MPRRCTQCTHINPSAAAFCWFDGLPLDGSALVPGESTSINFGVWAFPSPFVFPNGTSCRNFLQFALACQRHPHEAMDVLQQGFFESFFSLLGRTDLALIVRAAARMPDRERGLDELLAKIPGTPLEPPVLQVEPAQKDFGIVPVGEERSIELTLTNKKDRLLFGKASVDNCPWLVLGDAGTSEKLFQFFGKLTLPVRIAGARLRSYAKPQKAEIVIESNGGNVTVVVQVLVPVKPFPEGVLSGAVSPRQLAEKAKPHAKEAAVLLESGAVARWYEANGWTYPVKGPTATGIAAVQQLFEVLGFVKIPKVELSEPALTLRGKPGDHLNYTLTVVAQEKRPALGFAVSDQPWLAVGKTSFLGQMASIPLTVDSVPAQPNATLTANLKVTANGSQRFDVPVTLHIGDGPTVPPAPPNHTLTPVPDEESAITLVPHMMASPPAPLPTPVMAPAPVAVAAVAAVAVPEPPLAVVASSPQPVPVAASARTGMAGPLVRRLLPLGIVFAGLLLAVGRDWLFSEGPPPLPPEVDYDHPVLALKFHDTVAADDFVRVPTMRFGLGIPDPKDPKRFKTKLIYDEFGRTCNVCIRLDKAPADGYLLGVEQGAWEQPMKRDLGKDPEGHRLIGAKAVWIPTPNPRILITQYVEIVPGGLSADDKKQLLDTCVIRYDITNNDSLPHFVGLRFLLDTFIGSNDAVPFTIAGDRELCDTKKEFIKKSEVPDYISALERQDLKNPGIVARITLRYDEGLELPDRVELGAWPLGDLRELPGGAGAKALIQNTHWDVPFLNIGQAKKPPDNPDGDSAVTLYWNDKELQPRDTRHIGFAYGLGNVSGDKGSGQLAISAGGEMVSGKDFTLTAYVKNPAPGAKVKLTVPRGMQLASGSKETEDVPAIPPGSSSSFSPVTWRVQALKGGVYAIKVSLDSGARTQQKILVKQARENLH